MVLQKKEKEKNYICDAIKDNQKLECNILYAELQRNDLRSPLFCMVLLE